MRIVCIIAIPVFKISLFGQLTIVELLEGNIVNPTISYCLSYKSSRHVVWLATLLLKRWAISFFYTKRKENTKYKNILLIFIGDLQIIIVCLQRQNKDNNVVVNTQTWQIKKTASKMHTFEALFWRYIHQERSKWNIRKPRA